MAEHITDGTGISEPANPMKVSDNAAHVKLIGINGSASYNPLEKYMAAETDSSNVLNQYFGFESYDGSWYILNRSGANAITTSIRYAAGSIDLATSWSNRATSVTYGTAGSVF